MSEESRDSSLLSFVAQVSGEEFIKVEENLGDGFVRLNTTEAQRRQAKHDIRSVEDIIVELLRNARDAGAHRIFVASYTDGSLRHLVVIDDGSGVPEAMRDLIFEPRVTSKLDSMVMDEWGVHGRGMALYSISQNTTVCELAASLVDGGSSLHIAADTTTLKERADQSRWPKVAREEDRYVVESGPKNLVRNCVEFALAHEDIEVYLGSPAEIMATLVALGAKRYQSFAEALAEPKEASEEPLWKQPSLAEDVAALLACGSRIGLEISKRNAYRIFNHEIAALNDVRSRVIDALAPQPAQADIYRDARGLKIHSSDIAAFQVELEQAFDELAHKYFLTLTDEVKITVQKDRIRATFPFEKEQ